MRYAQYLLLITLYAAFFPKWCFSQENERKEILILHSMKEKRPWNLVYNKTLREELKQKNNLDIDLFVENLDLLQFNTEEYKDIVEKSLLYKYSNNLPDIIIITQPNAVKFINERGLFSKIPKILVVPSPKEFQGYLNSTTISYVIDFEKKINHALQIFPGTKEIYIVSGNSRIDSLTFNKFKLVTPKFKDKVSFKYLVCKSRSTILDEVKKLPEKSFVYYLSYTQDPDGKAYMAKKFSYDLDANSNRPVFCYLDLLTDNTGILGGMVVSLKSTARKTVEVIEKNLNGTKMEDIPPIISDYAYTYDWDELKKWKVDVSTLQQESVFYNQSYSFYELYKKEIWGGAILFSTYTILLILLIYNYRRKNKSENLLKEQNIEYELLNSKYEEQNKLLKEEKENAENNLNRLNTLICTIPDLVWLKDINGVYLTCNNRFEDFFGEKKEKIIGKTDYDFVDKELADFFRHHDKIAMEAGRPTVNEEKVTFASDNHTEHLETIKTPLYNMNNEIIGVLGIGRDISQRIEAENELLRAKENAEESEIELKKLNKDKDRFISILAHDLKSPLSSVLGLSGLLQKNIRKYNTEKIENQLGLIYDTSKRIFGLLEDILLWGKAQSGKMPFEPENINTKQVVLRVLENMNDIAGKKGISINIDMKEDLNIYADINMIRTVLRNLVSNAIKFTHRNGQISIESEKYNASVKISVSDNGVGIAPQISRKIFEIQDGYSTPGTDGEKGTGLGLQIVKEFVEANKGKVWVESKLGKGTKFCFTVPSSSELVSKKEENSNFTL